MVSYIFLDIPPRHKFLYFYQMVNSCDGNSTQGIILYPDCLANPHHVLCPSPNNRFLRWVFLIHRNTTFIANIVSTQWTLVCPLSSLFLHNWFLMPRDGRGAIHKPEHLGAPHIWLCHVFAAGLTLENFRPLTLTVQRSDGFLTQWCFNWNTGHQGQNRT